MPSERYVPPFMRTDDNRKAQEMAETARHRAQFAGLGDTEFSADVAAREGPIGYVNKNDPGVARYVKPKFITDDDLRDYGVHYPILDPKSGQTNTESFQLPIEGRSGSKEHILLNPGEVIAFSKNATPTTWAHEYRHRNNPDMDEETNRLYDAYSARNKREMDMVMKAGGTDVNDPVWRKAKMAQLFQEIEDRGISVGEYQMGARFKEDESYQDYKKQRDQQSFIMRELGR